MKRVATEFERINGLFIGGIYVRVAHLFSYDGQMNFVVGDWAVPVGVKKCTCHYYIVSC